MQEGALQFREGMWKVEAPKHTCDFQTHNYCNILLQLELPRVFCFV